MKTKLIYSAEEIQKDIQFIFSKKKFLDADEVKKVIEKIRANFDKKQYSEEYYEGVMIALDLIKQELKL